MRHKVDQKHILPVTTDGCYDIPWAFVFHHPDQTVSDYYLFKKLKEHFDSLHFSTNDEVEKITGFDKVWRQHSTTR